MKLSNKLAILGGFLAGAGAVALALLKHKQREEIYHEAELKAMNDLDQMMEEADACADCTCAEECASLDAEPQAADEAAGEAAEAADAPEAEAEPETKEPEAPAGEQPEAE